MTFIYHQDPAHGWLQVSHRDLFRLGLSYANFSSCSYVNLENMFLEEDCDMLKFLTAYKKKYGKEAELKEAFSDPCFVRELSHNPGGLGRAM